MCVCVCVLERVCGCGIAKVCVCVCVCVRREREREKRTSVIKIVLLAESLRAREEPLPSFKSKPPARPKRPGPGGKILRAQKRKRSNL